MKKLTYWRTILLISLIVTVVTQNCANPNPATDQIDSGNCILIKTEYH